MDIPESGAGGPKRKREIQPMIQFDNPHFGKQFLTQFEALDVIKILSEQLLEYERIRGPEDYGGG